ncbi:hypothetical protein RSSM_00375 [Rhodopirellula sallentina SM41]|uniref:Uncharacterized protein n=1 Tax=Rhodopirellula sallentina SM41 TaxID=1263870 RepID=M5UA88_9BACT|nr:hypothetical protein RSSM_00375 [Rhodopirellula sallentina SM41]
MLGEIENRSIDATLHWFKTADTAGHLHYAKLNFRGFARGDKGKGTRLSDAVTKK